MYVRQKNLVTLLFCCILLFISNGKLLAQQQPLLTKEKILELLKKNVTQQNITDQVSRYKVDFKLTDWRVTADLVRAGAKNPLLESIDKNYFSVLHITFGSWYPFGGINITTADDRSYFTSSGNMNSFSGYTTTSAFTIGSKRTLKVGIEGSGNCNFTEYDRMLKVIIGADQQPVLCANEGMRSPGDGEFIIRNDGTFEYQIPNLRVTNGVLTGLGFVFGPGTIKDLKVSAWFE